MTADGSRPAPNNVSFTIHGIGVSGGIAIGHAHLFAGMASEVDHYEITASDVIREQRRYDRAVKEVREELTDLEDTFRLWFAPLSPVSRRGATLYLTGPSRVIRWVSRRYMDLLRANGKMGRGVQLFHYMLKESLAADRPYDDFVRSLISGSAKSNLVVASVNPIVREHVEGKPGQVENGDDLRGRGAGGCDRGEVEHQHGVVGKAADGPAILPARRQSL
jgi:hypothetical protein